MNYLIKLRTRIVARRECIKRQYCGTDDSDKMFGYLKATSEIITMIDEYIDKEIDKMVEAESEDYEKD